MAEFRSDLSLILAKDKPNYLTSDHFNNNINLIFLSHSPKLLLCFFWETKYLKENNKQTDLLLIMSESKCNFGATCCTEHSGCSVSYY